MAESRIELTGFYSLMLSMINCYQLP